MRKARLMWALAAGAGFSLVVVMGGAGAMAGAATSDANNAHRFAKIDPSLFESSGPHAAFVPASLSDRKVSVVLQLAGDPVAVQDAEAQKQGQGLTDTDKHAARERLRAQQDQLDNPLAAAGATVVGKMQDAYNGVHVVVPLRNLKQLASLPGVIAVHAVQTFTPDNTNGVPFVGAPQAWQSVGVTGKGVKVAVIDTGIDYTHADFGGPGTAKAWSDAKANSTKPADPSLFGPGAPKVKGGYDFVGDAYNAQIPGSVPVPDPNPLDCNGHGTHTAGTLAGLGVLSTGKTYSGSYNSATISTNSWNVGPGVAPGADIYAYRVFGCAGSSNVVDLAIDRAVQERMDVISMSLGSDLGGPDEPTAMASQNAFKDGVAVIASAGNAGPSAYVVGSPSTANGVLSVAAIDGSTATYPGAKILSLNPPVSMIDANGAALPGTPKTVKVLLANGSVAFGCNEADYAGTTNMIVVTQRGNCARVARAVFGQKAGAAAVVMINNSSGYPPFEGPITSNPDTGEQVNVTIPFLGALTSDTTALKGLDGSSVTLTATTVTNPGYRKAASFTSGGPRNPDSAPKPDVMAPGVSVASAGMGTGTAAVIISGTSMSCPMTAGIAALIKEEHHSWTGAQIKAAIMNTANPALNTGYNPRLAGSGVVQAQNAVSSSVLATTSDALDSIAFGYVPGSGDYAAQKTFTMTNYGATTATYNLSVAFIDLARGANITIAPASATIAAGAASTITVSLTMAAAAFRDLPSVDNDSFGAGAGRSSVLTVRGNIVATPTVGNTSDHKTLRLPFMLVPRGLSNVVAGEPSGWIKAPAAGTPGHTIAASLSLANSGIHSGTADLYAWGVSEPRDSGESMDVRDVGVQVLPGPVLFSTNSDRGLVFLINTWGQATTQSLNEYDILIDTKGTGVPDFVLVGIDVGFALTGRFNGLFAAFTVNAKTGAIVDFFYADAPMNGSTIELPTLASDLGLFEKENGVGPVKEQGLTYSVDAFSLIPGGFVKFTGSARINPFSPSVSSGDFATLAPGASTTFTLTVDTDQQKAQPALGWLVASVDNANGAPQAREVMAPEK